MALQMHQRWEMLEILVFKKKLNSYRRTVPVNYLSFWSREGVQSRPINENSHTIRVHSLSIRMHTAVDVCLLECFFECLQSPTTQRILQGGWMKVFSHSHLLLSMKADLQRRATHRFLQKVGRKRGRNWCSSVETCGHEESQENALKPHCFKLITTSWTSRHHLASDKQKHSSDELMDSSQTVTTDLHRTFWKLFCHLWSREWREIRGLSTQNFISVQRFAQNFISVQRFTQNFISLQPFTQNFISVQPCTQNFILVQPFTQNFISVQWFVRGLEKFTAQVQYETELSKIFTTPYDTMDSNPFTAPMIIT